MAKKIAVLESVGKDFHSSVNELTNVLPFDLVIGIDCSQSSVANIRHIKGKSLKFPSLPLPLVYFYKKLSDTFPDCIIYRIHNPVYPISVQQVYEIDERFPLNICAYVLSNAEECGLNGYFLERFNRDFIHKLLLDDMPILPVGYFNGMAYTDSRRHWFSLSLRRYYLEDLFEEFFDSPRFVCINAMPECNYSCQKCQYRSPRIQTHVNFSNEVMSLERFKTIVDICKAYKRLTTFVPTISGESLLHPEIIDIIRYVKSKGYSMGLATNGSLLTGELGKRLLDAGLDSMMFSVDAVSPDRYKELQGGDLKVVEENILRFIRNARIKRGNSFSMVLNFVISSKNEDEIELFRRTWLEERGITVNFQAEHEVINHFNPYFNFPEWGPDSRMPCWALWYGLYLTSEGKVVTCGSMAKSQGMRDSIFETPPDALWRWGALNSLRKSQLTGDIPAYCDGFSCWTGQMQTWIYKDKRLRCYTYSSWMELPPQSYQLVSRISLLERTKQKLVKFLKNSR